MLRVSILKGNTLVIDNQLDLDLDKFFRVIERYKCTSAWLGPTQLITLSKHLDRAQPFDLTSLREIKTGGAVLPQSVMTTVAEQTGGRIWVHNVYGLTEVGDLTAAPNGSTGSAAGSLLATHTVTIVDAVTSEALPLGQVGEVCVSGPQVTPGYWKREDANKQHFSANGFFRTGDIGYFDDDGLLFIIDRLKEVIKAYGEQVTPAELESVLLSHDSVAEAAVVGVPDQRICEVPVAFVVLKDSSTPPEGILDHVNQQVADYKQMREVRVVASLPKISIGKVDRRQLKERALTACQQSE